MVRLLQTVFSSQARRPSGMRPWPTSMRRAGLRVEDDGTGMCNSGTRWGTGNHGQSLVLSWPMLGSGVVGGGACD